MLIETFRGYNIYEIEKKGRLVYKSDLGVYLTVEDCKAKIVEKINERYGVTIARELDVRVRKENFHIMYTDKFSTTGLYKKDMVLRHHVFSGNLNRGNKIGTRCDAGQSLTLALF